MVESLGRETNALHLRLTQFRALYALESGHGNKPKFTRRVTKICHIWKPFTQKRVQYASNDVDILLRVFLAISLVGENCRKLSISLTIPLFIGVDGENTTKAATRSSDALHDA